MNHASISFFFSGIKIRDDRSALGIGETDLSFLVRIRNCATWRLIVDTLLLDLYLNLIPLPDTLDQHVLVSLTIYRFETYDGTCHVGFDLQG